jgi:hypothetical protein
VVHHSASGVFAIRKGKYKFIDGVGSGGWSGKGDGLPGQLYNLEIDPTERNNLYDDSTYRSIVTDLRNILEQYKQQGHSRPST